MPEKKTQSLFGKFHDLVIKSLILSHTDIYIQKLICSIASVYYKSLQWYSFSYSGGSSQWFHWSGRRCSFPNYWWSVRNFRWCIWKRCNCRELETHSYPQLVQIGRCGFLPSGCWKASVFPHTLLYSNVTWCEVMFSEFLVGIFHPKPVWVRFWELAQESQLAYISCWVYQNTKLSVLAHRLKWKVPQKYLFAASWWEPSQCSLAVEFPHSIEGRPVLGFQPVRSSNGGRNVPCE